MRVSTLQTTNTMLNYMTSAESKYYELTQEATSGLKVDEPSDDPVAAQSLLNIKGQLSQLNGYSANMKTAQSELATVNTTLDAVTDLVEKASDYATQAANGTYGASDLSDIKSQIDSMTETAVGYANTQFEGNYIFSGTSTAQQTYTVAHDANGKISSITYNGTSSSDYERSVTISDGVSVGINAKGSDVFGSYNSTVAAPVTAASAPGDVTGVTSTTSTDANGVITTTTTNKVVSGGNTTTTTTTETGNGLFYTLGTLSTALGNNNTTVVNASIDRLTSNLDTVTANATKLAGVSNRMDMTTDSISNTVTNLKSYRSDLQDADLTEVMTELATSKSALEATYKITSQMLSSNSLLDYL